MREYSIYWIKEEFASHYFYKSDILYRFLQSYRQNTRKEDLLLQFNYITKDIPSISVISELQKKYSNYSTIQLNGNVIEIFDGSYKITLHMYKKHIKFRCESLQDAESLLFPVLRLIYPYIFITEKDSINFGWISPVTTSMLHHDQEVLYSYH